MTELTITVTEAAPNFADCVNRSHYLNTSFVLLKNGRPFARIEPDAEKRGPGRELADALTHAELSAEDAGDWYRELRTARNALHAPTDRWQFNKR